MIDEEDKKSSVQTAITYVDTPVNDFSSWKTKDLGLQFLLFGVAEIQAKRVIKLLERVSYLEETVFSDDNLRELEPLKMLETYKVATMALKEATDFISKTRKEMDWDGIYAQLDSMTLKEKIETGDTIQVSKMSNKLLEAMLNRKDEKDGK